MAAVAGKEIDRLVLRITADAMLLKKELLIADKAVKGFALKTAATMKMVGASMMGLGRSMTMYVSLPLAYIGAASVVAFAQFETAMTKSVAIMSGVTSELRADMEATANSIAKNTVTSATKAAEAYFFLASAGMDAATAIRALPKVNTFAIAGNFDMALATDLLTDAQSALGLSVGTTTMKMAQMSRVSDVLVRANTLANATVQQFSTALTTKAGAALKSFNKDVEEGVAVLAAMADQGIKGELAGASLDRMIRLLSKSAIQNTEVHDELGFAVFSEAGEMRNLGDIIGNLEDVLAGMSDETKVATLAQLGFSADVQQTILPLLGTADAIRKYELELRSASGYTSLVAEKNQATFAAKMKMTWNEIVLVAKSIGELLVPKLEWMAAQVEWAIDLWNGLSDGWKSAIVTIGVVVMVAGPLLMILGGMLTVIASMIVAYPIWTGWIAAHTGATSIATFAQWAFNAAVSANPYVWMAIAIAAAIVVLVLLVGWLSGAFDAYQQLAAAKKEQTRLDEAWFESQKKTMENNVEEIMGIKDKKKAAIEYELLMKSSRRNEEAKMENIRTEKKLLLDLQRQQAAGEGDMAELDTAIQDAEYMIELQTKQHELLEEQADEYEKMNQLRLIELQDAKDIAAGNNIRSELIEDEVEAIDKQNIALKEQVATYGMSNAQIEIYRAKLKGATDAQLEQTQAMADENDAMEAQLTAMEESEKEKEDLIKAEEQLVATTLQMNQALDDQIATFNMTTAEIAAYNAEAAGLAAGDVEIIRLKTEKLEAMQAEKKQMEENEKETKKLKEEGERLTKSLRTPAEKMAEAQDKLKEMLEAGQISVETYARGMEKIEKEVNIKVSFKVSGIDAVAAGSVEAMMRVEEFRAMAEGKGPPKVDHRAGGSEIKTQYAAEGDAIQAMWEEGAGVGQGMDLASIAGDMSGLMGSVTLANNVGGPNQPSDIQLQALQNMSNSAGAMEAAGTLKPTLTDGALGGDDPTAIDNRDYNQITADGMTLLVQQFENIGVAGI